MFLILVIGQVEGMIGENVSEILSYNLINAAVGS